MSPCLPIASKTHATSQRTSVEVAASFPDSISRGWWSMFISNRGCGHVDEDVCVYEKHPLVPSSAFLAACIRASALRLPTGSVTLTLPSRDSVGLVYLLMGMSIIYPPLSLTLIRVFSSISFFSLISLGSKIRPSFPISTYV